MDDIFRFRFELPMNYYFSTSLNIGAFNWISFAEKIKCQFRKFLLHIYLIRNFDEFFKI